MPRDVLTDEDRAARLVELETEKATEEAARKAADEERKRQNTGFTQVYPKGWARLQDLIQKDPAGARIYAFIAQHMDARTGALVVSQETMAEAIGVHERTIRRITKRLEDQAVMVRIRVGAGVYAYCLDAAEVWKSWDDEKQHAAFTTRTLVKKADRENGTVKRKLMVMLKEPRIPGL